LAHDQLDPPTEVSVSFIDDHRAESDVESICRLLPIASSTHYAAKRRDSEPSARAVRDAAMRGS
jgi:hypothetical protein